MACDMRYARDVLPEKLAEQGWDQDDIDLLEKEIELARRKAEKEAYGRGDSYAKQQAAMDDAEQKARKVAHDRMHARLEAAMDEIRKLGDAKKIPVHHGHGREVDRDDTE